MTLRCGLLMLVEILIGAGSLSADDGAAPISVVSGLFQQENETTLGLAPPPGTRTFTVFRPQAEENHYNHGAVLVAFRGRLWMQWQSSARDEDAEDTRVLYSVSDDSGETWSRPEVLARSRDEALVTNGGWVTDGKRLVAYLNVWPRKMEPKAGFLEWMESADGKTWTDPRRVTMKDGQPFSGVMEQDVRALGNGRLLSAGHFQPGLHVAPCMTDDPLGRTGWERGEMPASEDLGATSRAIEPGWFRRRDGSLVMTFRDQKGSFRVMASESTDGGRSWSRPVVTSLPDSRSKQSAGNLPDGTAFIVNNPTGRNRRSPLVMTLSRDGRRFDRAFLLRALGDEVEAMQWEGRYKREGFSYPKTLVTDDFIFVAHAVHKERIELVRVPTSSFND